MESRKVFEFVEMRIAAERALARAELEEEGSYYECLVLYVMSGFMVEGYVNALGLELIEGWAQGERRSIWTKLSAVAERVGVNLEYKRTPFSFVSDVIELRNEAAHPKAPFLPLRSEQGEIREDEMGKPLKVAGIEIPQTKLQDACHDTPRARQTFAGCCSAIEQLHAAAGFQDPFAYLSGSSPWSEPD